jgi:two-component system CheB/CheR fusion protein
MRSKQDMLDILGDELRNPLAAMALSLARMQARDQDQDEPDRDYETLRRQIDRLSALVTELLDGAEACSAVVPLERERVEVRSFISDALASARTDRAAHPVDVVVDVARRDLAVWGDRSLLRRALAEVLRNAIKFARDDRRLHIRVCATADRGQALIRVADDGAGVSPDKLDAIFEPFVQGFPPETRPVRGLGLGLTIVRRLVQLHGGDVRAMSSGPGRGFEIAIRLPLARGG